MLVNDLDLSPWISIVVLSTYKAEFMALAAARQESKFLMQLLKSIMASDLFNYFTFSFCEKSCTTSEVKTY